MYFSQFNLVPVRTSRENIHNEALGVEGAFLGCGFSGFPLQFHVLYLINANSCDPLKLLLNFSCDFKMMKTNISEVSSF